MDKITWDNLYIVTDDPDNVLPQRFVLEYGAKIIHGEALEDFNFIKAANRLAISASSFSWWAAWLSDATEIYVPLVGYFDSRVRPDIDLIVDDEERFKHIKWPGDFISLAALKMIIRGGWNSGEKKPRKLFNYIMRYVLR